MTLFEKAFETIQQLVITFDNGYKHYMNATYSEADARKDFIDKFFIAFGWDVNHDIQTNPYEQEVKIERSQKQQNESARKRADYAFFITPNFKEEAFFVEAKKPSVLIESNPQHYFQTIRYGWNAGCPISVLTDFEEFVIIDCRNKPDIKYALNGKHKSYSYKDYLDKEKFAEIYWLFSREAVLNNSIKKYVENLPKPHGKVIQKSLFKGSYQAIDDSFLVYIDGIRENLAKAFKKNDTSLNSEQLTEAVQKTVDRLVFIRFLEDKFIEADSHVNEWQSWKDFVADCRKLDAKYNGVVFKKHFIDEQDFAGAEERWFLDICQDISSLNSPYLFNYIPIHILGSIYERFLGKVVTITNSKNVEINDKPEVRRAGGVFYTPKYIVEYIVQNTIGKQIENKNPKQIADLKFADISCGSGSFLIGVYDYLLEYHKKYYINKLVDKIEIDKRSEDFGNVEYRDGVWTLTLKLKQDILLNNVFGVDIDAQAVEVTQLSLFLKMLEDENLNSTRQIQLVNKVLPDLTKNVICGNSLVSFDIMGLFEDDDLKRLNPMDYKSSFPNIMRGGGFDTILGNPPYDVIEKERLGESVPHAGLHEYVQSKSKYIPALGGKLNLFRLFIVQAFSLLKQNSKFSFIIPLSIVGDKSCSKTRAYLLKKSMEIQFDCFPQKDNVQKRVFKDAKLSTCIFICTVNNENENEKLIFPIRTYPGSSFDEGYKETRIDIRKLKTIDKENLPIPLIDNEDWLLLYKLHSAKNTCNFSDLSNEILIRRGEINQTIFRKYIEESTTGNERLIKGVQIGTYKFNLKISQGKVEWFNEVEYLKENNAKDISLNRRIATQRITGVDERLRLVATIIEPKAYFADSTNSIHLANKSKYSLEYILALINSKLFQWRFKVTSTNNNVGTNEIESLPFRKINFKDLQDKEIHSSITKLVVNLIEAKQKALTAKTDKDKNFLLHQCESFENSINDFVYQLYDLTHKQIEIIETRQSRPLK